MRSALKMALTWAAAWFAVGGAIELGANLWPAFPLASLVDIWPFVLAVPGFVAGALFALLVRLVDGHRRFDELSLARFALLGAASGAALIATAAVLGFESGSIAFALRRAVAIGLPITALSALTAVATLVLARVADGGLLAAPRAFARGALHWDQAAARGE